MEETKKQEKVEEDTWSDVFTMGINQKGGLSYRFCTENPNIKKVSLTDFAGMLETAKMELLLNNLQDKRQNRLTKEMNDLLKDCGINKVEE